MVVVIYPKFPLFKVPGTYVSIRAEDLLLSLMFLINIPFLILNTKSILKVNVVRSYIILLFIAFLSLVSGLFVMKSIQFHIGFLHLLRRVEYFIPFIICLLIPFNAKSTDNISREKNINFYINVILVIVSVVFVYGFGQKSYSWPVIVTQNEEYSSGIALRYQPGGHINSTFAGHYDLSGFLLLVVPLLVTIFSVKGFNKKSVYGNLILLIGIICSLWLMAFSGSRISALALLGSVTLSLLVVRKYLYIPFFIVLSLLIFGLSPSLKDRYIRIYEVSRDSIQKIISQNLINSVYAAEVLGVGLPEKTELVLTPTPIPIFEDRSTSIRLNVEWPRALRAFMKNPLLGTGYSSITLATDNDYLRMIGETGILGFTAFILVILNFFSIIKRELMSLNKLDWISKILSASFGASLMGILVIALFIDIFEASKFAICFWIFAGLFVRYSDYFKKLHE